MNLTVMNQILLTQKPFQKALDATQLYLGEIGFSPLLSAEEEVYFAKEALKEMKLLEKE